MSETYIQAIRAEDIAPGGMKVVEIRGTEMIVCNNDGAYFCVQRRCGHMNASLELGTLDGKYLTCPMHCAQFDITNGDALSGPIPVDMGHDAIPPLFGQFMQNMRKISQDVETECIHTYPLKVEDGWVQIWIE